MSMHRVRSVTVVLAMWSALAAEAVAADLTITDVGAFSLNDASGSGAVELSGLTWAGGTTYYAVNDNAARLYTLNIDVNAATGQITTAAIAAGSLQLRNGAGVALSGSDREGVAFDGAHVWIANENGPELSRHDLASGNRLSQVTTASHASLGVFSNIVANRSWESLTRQTNGQAYWTANEEALSVDGPASTGSTGTVVRLTKFDSAMSPLGQWAYVTQPHNGAALGQERSGVADLVALDDGRVLVLERAFGATGYTLRIYLADTAGATDVSVFTGGLTGETYVPINKGAPLWQMNFGAMTNANFEGITLGPTLANGDRSLILVADNNGGFSPFWGATQHSLYALTLSVPEPAVGTILLLMGLVAAARRR